jgi:ribonuclease-3
VEAFSGRIEYAATTHVDFKTELQEQLASMGRQVTYSVVDVEGPPHDRKFTSAAVIDGDEVGVGIGRSKKAAEQEAARQALEKIRS